MKSWTPVTPLTGGLVHMTSLTSATRTQCGKVCTGWRISIEKVDCAKCQAAVHYPVKTASRKKADR